MVARADVEQARIQLRQVQELAALDTRSAWAELVAARAAWAATSGTVQQAARAFEIAQVRYQAGLSTQLELSDARLLSQQAEANRALAARDLQVRGHERALPPAPERGGADAQGAVPYGATARPAPSSSTKVSFRTRRRRPDANGSAITWVPRVSGSGGGWPGASWRDARTDGKRAAAAARGRADGQENIVTVQNRYRTGPIISGEIARRGKRRRAGRRSMTP